ncbi:hypothetical protein [Parafilimonas sp.]|uniref:hypothetical protein n=1 Tax=Parafilimonas sp. TaxID=1969739 RepID=UPI003F7F9A13
MQKGTMITVIVDGVTRLNSLFEIVTKKIKEDKVITEKESAYITGVFNEKLKEGNQSIEKIKELISPKSAMSEADKLQLLTQMFTVMKENITTLKRFEKGFVKLCEERKAKLTDIKEVTRLFDKEKQRT